MNDKELQELKNEIAQLAIRQGNVEGYFDNFNTTLENHMGDYKAEQLNIGNSVRGLKTLFWVAFGLATVAITGLIAIAALVVQWATSGGRCI